MQTVKVPITGINRAVDEGIATDGQTMELINARVKNGSIEPISKPIELGELPISNVSAMYYHSASGRYIAVSQYSCYALKLTGSNWTADAMSSDLYGATDVKFMGNVAIFTKSDKLIHAIWRGEDDGYDVLGVAPKLPKVIVNVETTSEQVYNHTQLYAEREDEGDDGIAVEQTVGYAASGTFMQLRSKLAKRGYFAGTNLMLLRYAFRTPAGSYIMHSPLILVCCNSTVSTNIITDIHQETQAFASLPMGGFYAISGVNPDYDGSHTGRHYEYQATAPGFKPTFTLAGLSGLAAWEGFVSSIDVFVAPIFNYKMVQYVDRYESGNDKYMVYDAKTSEEIKEEVFSTTMMYKVAEFDLHGNKSWELDDVSLDVLTLQEKLTDDQFSRNTITGTTYVYNNMLHVGNITETFFKGYDLDVSRSGLLVNSGSSNLTAYTSVGTSEGNVVVSNTTSGIDVTNMHPLLSYPDSRATTMVLETTVGGSTVRRRFALTAHRTLNMAYYFGGDLTATEVTTMSGADLVAPQTYFTTDALNARTDGADVTSQLFSASPAFARPNVIKVSELSNPIFYPASHTYTPSNAVVIGMCANTQAISQGQFGSFPLYAFCADGVYAMQVGSGSIAYASIAPVSRDVCTNAASITGIDSAVVFATSRGLMAISGSSTKLLSQAIDGWLPSTLNSNIVNSQETNILVKIANIAGFATALSQTEFTYYLEGATIAYNYPDHELIINNPTYNYAYVYGMETGEWSKISPGVDFFVRRYPECEGVRDGKLYNLYNQHRSVSKMLILTRPFKFGTEDNKRILQAALRGVVKSAMSDLYLRGEPVLFRDESLLLFSECGFYVLGSKDAEKWELLVGKDGNAQVQNFRNLIMGMNKSRPFKFFMIAFVGGVRSDVAINYVEFISDTAFDNRLR